MRTPDADPLLAMMQAGDLEALDRIARQYGPRLIAVAMRCCRFPHDAEDAVQSAMLAASRSMVGFRGDGSPVAWLSTLVARSCYRMNRRPVGQDDADVHETPCTCGDPATALEHKRLGERLGDALMQLSRTDRLLVLLASDGWTGPEIAAQFGMTPNAVRSRLKRGARCSAISSVAPPPTRAPTRPLTHFRNAEALLGNRRAIMAEVLRADSASFETEVLSPERSGVVLVDFEARWCPPCRALAPVLQAIAAEGRRVVKVNVDDDPAIAARFGVRATPTFLVFRDGVPVGQLVGAQSRAALVGMLERAEGARRPR